MGAVHADDGQVAVRNRETPAIDSDLWFAVLARLFTELIGVLALQRVTNETTMRRGSCRSCVAIEAKCANSLLAALSWSANRRWSSTSAASRRGYARNSPASGLTALSERNPPRKPHQSWAMAR